MLSKKKKQKLAKAIGVVADLLEKCGGPGSGIPGPCPSGQSGSRNPSFRVVNLGGAGYAIQNPEGEYLSAYGGWSKREENALIMDSREQATSRLSRVRDDD